MDQHRRTVFIPNGDSRKETAARLTKAAEDNGISQRAISTISRGFYVTEELAEALGHDGGTPVPENTSNRAKPTLETQVPERRDVMESAGVRPSTKKELAHATAVANREAAAEDEEPEEDEDVPDYNEWDYADLVSEVSTRGIETEDKKKDTLVAALRADDEASAE